LSLYSSWLISFTFNIFKDQKQKKYGVQIGPLNRPISNRSFLNVHVVFTTLISYFVSQLMELQSFLSCRNNLLKNYYFVLLLLLWTFFFHSESCCSDDASSQDKTRVNDSKQDLFLEKSTLNFLTSRQICIAAAFSIPGIVLSTMVLVGKCNNSLDSFGYYMPVFSFTVVFLPTVYEWYYGKIMPAFFVYVALAPSTALVSSFSLFSDFFRPHNISKKINLSALKQFKVLNRHEFGAFLKFYVSALSADDNCTEEHFTAVFDIINEKSQYILHFESYADLIELLIWAGHLSQIIAAASQRTNKTLPSSFQLSIDSIKTFRKTLSLPLNSNANICLAILALKDDLQSAPKDPEYATLIFEICQHILHKFFHTYQKSRNLSEFNILMTALEDFPQEYACTDLENLILHADCIPDLGDTLNVDLLSDVFKSIYKINENNILEKFKLHLDNIYATFTNHDLPSYESAIAKYESIVAPRPDFKAVLENAIKRSKDFYRAYSNIDNFLLTHVNIEELFDALAIAYERSNFQPTKEISSTSDLARKLYNRIFIICQNKLTEARDQKACIKEIEKTLENYSSICDDIVGGAGEVKLVEILLNSLQPSVSVQNFEKDVNAAEATETAKIIEATETAKIVEATETAKIVKAVETVDANSSANENPITRSYWPKSYSSTYGPFPSGGSSTSSLSSSFTSAPLPTSFTSALHIPQDNPNIQNFVIDSLSSDNLQQSCPIISETITYIELLRAP
jgi:hypothetical protein